MKIIHCCFTLVFLIVLLVSTPTSAQNNNLIPERVYQVNDIFPGTDEGYPFGFSELSGRVYFQANDGIHGEEIWYSDGTKEGTRLLKDINVGSEQSVYVFRSVVFNNKLFFGADDGVHGEEIWQSDSTEAGTRIFKDVYSGSIGSSPEILTVANGLLYFCAADPSGSHIWRTDETSGGTLKITTIPLSVSDRCDQLTTKGVEFQGMYYFIFNSGYPSGYQVSRTDGTPGSIERIENEDPNIGYSNPTKLTVVGNQLFFAADASINGYGLDLWVIDESTGKSRLVKNISPNTYGNADPQELTSFQGKLYFTANDGSINNRKLWVSDGTSENTNMVPFAIGQEEYNVPEELTVYGKSLLFRACYQSIGCELASSDGEQVKLIKNINTGNCSDIGECSSAPEYFTVINEQVLFNAASDWLFPNDRELWRTDGTAEGTVRVADICNGTCSGDPWYLKRVGNRVYFSATDSETGRELWAYEPSLQWTYLPLISR